MRAVRARVRWYAPESRYARGRYFRTQSNPQALLREDLVDPEGIAPECPGNPDQCRREWHSEPCKKSSRRFRGFTDDR